MNLKALLLLLLFVFASGCNSKKSSPTLVIATAANMQFAVKALTNSFTETSGISCEIITNSSGKLTAQISHGAPFDVFISADMKYPTELFNLGMTVDKPTIYGYGKVVLWTMDKDIIPSVSILSEDIIQHIAIANAKTAPYGIAAEEVIRHYQLSDLISKKLVYGESISQTNQFIASGSAEIGFTAKSTVMLPDMAHRGSWIEISDSTYQPIAQGVVLIKHNEGTRSEAKKFYEFLFSEKGEEILRKYGF